MCRQNRYSDLFIACFGIMVTIMGIDSPTPLTNQLVEAYGSMLFSNMFTMFVVACVVTFLFVGQFIDVYGSRLGLIVSLVLGIVGQVLVGTGIQVSGGEAAILLGRFFAGLTFSGATPSVVTLLARTWKAHRHYSIILALINVTFPRLGSILIFFLGPMIVKKTGLLSSAFFFVAGCLVLALVFSLFAMNDELATAHAVGGDEPELEDDDIIEPKKLESMVDGIPQEEQEEQQTCGKKVKSFFQAYATFPAKYWLGMLCIVSLYTSFFPWQTILGESLKNSLCGADALNDSECVVSTVPGFQLVSQAIILVVSPLMGAVPISGVWEILLVSFCFMVSCVIYTLSGVINLNPIAELVAISTAFSIIAARVWPWATKAVEQQHYGKAQSLIVGAYNLLMIAVYIVFGAINQDNFEGQMILAGISGIGLICSLCLIFFHQK